MQKSAPSVGKVLLMVGFALSCVGILLYLWLVFGGSTPLKPKGYRVDVPFPEAPTLAQEADVRISGVPVGRVKAKELNSETRTTDVTIEIDSKYAPLPRDTRAVLRAKTLLGETYVELSPGNPDRGRLDDGDTLGRGQISETVELDEIFRAFDRPTRAAFRTWLDQQGIAYGENGEALNDALGNLAPFAEDTTEVLEVLREQSRSTQALVRNTGEVFEALSERKGQLSSLITNSNRVFETTASRDEALADLFRVLPTFLDESRVTATRVTRFAEDTDPLIDQLRPAARELTPTLLDLRDLAPHLRALFRDLGPLITVSRRGLPATERFLDETRPFLAQVDPFIRNINPMLDWIGLYRREIASFFALDAAATQATDQPAGTPRPLHYLRTTNPVNPEVLAAYPRRLPTNRSNPYTEPGGYAKLPTGLEVFGEYLCTANPIAQVSPVLSDLLPDSTRALIQQFVFTATGPAAPPCKPQAPLGRFLDPPRDQRYPHIEAEPAE